MDDALYGKEDARGNWAPNKPVSYGPAFQWPPDPRALFKWFFGFPGYLLPWNVLYAVAAIGIWTFLTPSLESMRSFSLWWVALILVRNVGLAIARLRRLAHVALRLAEAGHELQVQPAMAEGEVGGVHLRQPDLRQHVLHAGQRRADLDRVRGAAPLGLRERHCSAHHVRGASGLVHRGLLPGALHPRGGLLLRPPLHALAAALPGRAQPAPPEHQSGPMVRPVDAPDRAPRLFLVDPPVLHHPLAPDPHDQPRVPPRRGAGAGSHRASTAW